MSNPVPPVADPLSGPLSDVAKFASCLQAQGLLGALRFLNTRTSHRYTGVFRFDGETLRNLVLVDRWKAEVTAGDDVPLALAYCAHLERTGESLLVEHGPTDDRVPWMANSATLSYCGSVISAPDGTRWGALCHFDTLRCDATGSELPLLDAAADLIYAEATKASR